MTWRKSILLFIGLGMIAALVACSSSSSKPPITVTLSTTPTSVYVSATISITATTNDTAGVNWSAKCQSGASPCGSFSAPTSTTGVAVTYTAPANPDTVTLTATSVTNTSVAASTPAITVSAVPTVTLSTVPAAVYVNDYFSITASTTDPSGVNWTAACQSGASPCGAFSATSSATGVAVTYTAPANPDSVTITATSVSDTSVSASTPAITVNATSGYTVSISTPPPASMTGGATATVAATTTDPAGVTWTCTTAGTTACSSANFSPASTLSGATTTFTAPNGTETVTVTATSASDDAISDSDTVSVTSAAPPPLAGGSYVFYVSGFDNNGNPYEYMGVFKASGSVSGGVEQINGGEQDFSDAGLDASFTSFITAEPITGGTITQSPDVGSGDTNLIITLNFTDSYISNGTGTTTLNASMASSTKGLISEYDGWASGTGELNLQDFTPVAGNPLCATTPCGYVFVAGGLDGTLVYGATNGGVIVVDGAGGSISGNGSVWDANDACGALNSSDECEGASYPGNTLSTSGVSSMDQFGLVTFTINSPDYTVNPVLVYDGYAIDPTHIRLVERWDVDGFEGTTGGGALGQTSVGGFGDSSVDGSTYVVSMTGYNNTAGNYLTTAGAISFSSGNLGGNVSFNDISFQSPQGGEAVTAGTYTVSSTGDFTLSGITDTAGDYFYDLQLYLTGDGHALVMSMDAGNTNADTLGGLGWAQATGLTSASLSGNYALALGQDEDGATVDGDGVVSASSGTISGFLDQNETFIGKGLVADKSIGATYPASTSGIIDLTGSGGGENLLTIYLVDTDHGVVIENDDSALSLGYFANQ